MNAITAVIGAQLSAAEDRPADDSDRFDPATVEDVEEWLAKCEQDHWRLQCTCGDDFCHRHGLDEWVIANGRPELVGMEPLRALMGMDAADPDDLQRALRWLYGKHVRSAIRLVRQALVEVEARWQGDEFSLASAVTDALVGRALNVKALGGWLARDEHRWRTDEKMIAYSVARSVAAGASAIAI